MDLIDAHYLIKQSMVAATGGSHALLHVHAGLAIYLLAQFALGTRRGSVLALALVVQLALLNELLDRAHHGSWRIDDTLSDLALTLFWPTVLVALAELQRRIWKPAAARPKPSRRARPTG